MKVGEQDGISARMGPYHVSLIRHMFIPLTSGIKLAARVWFPQQDGVPLLSDSSDPIYLYSPSPKVHVPKMDAKYPAILEYLPYRKSEVTAQRDYMRHTWFASHGYVCIRADMRGCGMYANVF